MLFCPLYTFLGSCSHGDECMLIHDDDKQTILTEFPPLLDIPIGAQCSQMKKAWVFKYYEGEGDIKCSNSRCRRPITCGGLCWKINRRHFHLGCFTAENEEKFEAAVLVGPLSDSIEKLKLFDQIRTLKCFKDQEGKISHLEQSINYNMASPSSSTSSSSSRTHLHPNLSPPPPPKKPRVGSQLPHEDFESYLLRELELKIV